MNENTPGRFNNERSRSEFTSTEQLIHLIRAADQAYIIRVKGNLDGPVPKIIRDALKEICLPAIKLEGEVYGINSDGERIFKEHTKEFYVPRSYIIEELLREGYVSSADWYSRHIPPEVAGLFISQDGVEVIEETDPENLLSLF